jgi:hypothetical protein
LSQCNIVAHIPLPESAKAHRFDLFTKRSNTFFTIWSLREGINTNDHFAKGSNDAWSLAEFRVMAFSRWSLRERIKLFSHCHYLNSPGEANIYIIVLHDAIGICRSLSLAREWNPADPSWRHNIWNWNGIINLDSVKLILF